MNKEKILTIKITEEQERILEAKANSGFLYLVNPNGYVGDSGKFEMGFAHGKGIPIYSSNFVTDTVLKNYVWGVYSPKDICELVNNRKSF